MADRAEEQRSCDRPVGAPDGRAEPREESGRLASGQVMNLPPVLLKAISAAAGGQVVLVIGAGTSVEAPTGLPMSRKCSTDAHSKLLANGILTEGECADPKDLSVLAETVFEKEGKQRPLVECLPIGPFRAARPNEGALHAAALLREGALGSVITLNFDLALAHALAALGADEDVAIVDGPTEHERLGAKNLIYLHRSVNADPEEWILRTVDLEKAWEERWEEVVVKKVVGAPVTVFAGLGTAAGVLVAAANHLRAAVPGQAAVFLVDPSDQDESEFAASLDLETDAYIQRNWCGFMAELARRLMVRFTAELQDACRELTEQQDWLDPDPDPLCARLGELSLVEFGRLRARWLLDNSPYLPDARAETKLLADLLLAVGFIEQATTTVAAFYEDGVVEFYRDGNLLISAVFASGGGHRNWEAMEVAAGSDPFRRSRPVAAPRFAIFAGAREGRPVDTSPPASLFEDTVEENVAGGETLLEPYSVSELRECTEVLVRMVA